MNFDALFSLSTQPPISVGLVGVSRFGATFLGQARHCDMCAYLSFAISTLSARAIASQQRAGINERSASAVAAA